MNNKTHTSRHLSLKIARYKRVAWGSALAICPAANAGVVVFAPAGGPLTASTSSYISWDMTSNSAGVGVYPNSTYEFGLSDHDDIHTNNAAGSAVLGFAKNVQNLSAGYSIGVGSANWEGSYAYWDNFGAPSRGFIGLRFQIAGSDHYGWAEVEFEGSNQTLHSWAYEDQAGVAILAGAGLSAVPEPASNLALLALGSAGVLSHRRRRRAA